MAPLPSRVRGSKARAGNYHRPLGEDDARQVDAPQHALGMLVKARQFGVRAASERPVDDACVRGHQVGERGDADLEAAEPGHFCFPWDEADLAQDIAVDAGAIEERPDECLGQGRISSRAEASW